MCLHSIKYLGTLFSHMALRSQENSNATGGYGSAVPHSYIDGWGSPCRMSIIRNANVALSN